jgi:tetratricopeptide (TPR) repeat protein
VQSPQYSKHYEQGLAFKKAGDANRALIEFLQAIKENPRCTKAFYEQALLFRQKGYPKLAESSLCQALAIDPSFRDARILLAAVRLEAGNTGGAAQELTRSLGLSSAKYSAQSPAQGQQVASPQAPTLAPSQGKAAAKTTAAAPPAVPQPSAPATSEVNQRKNSLQFIPEGGSPKDSPNPERTATNKSQASHPIDNDDWAKRLRYLSIHGTGTLKAGEAFMFSEETGEAVIFLTNGTRIRRIITAPQDTHELVKARRPDMLIPADLLYKLSTLGKLVASDPSALIDTNAAENPDLEPAKKKEYFDADLDSEDQAEDTTAKKSSKHKPEKGTLGELMDSNEDTDNSDNKFTHKVILEDSPRDKASSPIIPNDATKGPNLESTEPSSMKDFNKDPVNDSLLDKTQKLFGWFKKALHLP